MLITEKVQRYAAQYDMLPRGGTVLCCVSGGADSMCLLDILSRLSDVGGFTVAAAHFNHNLRGAESDGDEAFVRAWCEEHGIPLCVGSGDVNAYAARHALGTEEAARELRYAFFYETAAKLPDARIATAHNADDNLETLLFRLARGTGPKGLGGIPPVRGAIIRPLLSVTRAEIEAYLAENAVPHREDSTNSSDDYSRNKLRHRVMPVLREVNPEASSAAGRLAELARRDNEYLDGEAHRFLGEHYDGDSLSAAALAAAPFPIASRALRLLCGDIAMEHIERMISLAKKDAASEAISVSGMTIRREYDRIFFSASHEATFSPVALTPGSTALIPEINTAVVCENTEFCGFINKSFTSFLFKSESICGKITVRPRLTGDFIKLNEKSGTKSLKKLFIEKKIPRSRRAAVPVLADEAGVIAVCGLGADVRTWPKKGDNVLKVTFEVIKND